MLHRRLLREGRAHLSSSGRVLVIRAGRTLREVPVGRAHVLEWLRALAVRCIRRGRSRVVQAEDREDRALRHGRALVRVVQGLGTGRELLRVG
jgi:hypothetical protein